MGNGASMPTDKEQEMINKKIEKLIADDKKKDLSLKKLLLLGGSECGKSTLAKQIKQNIIESIALCLDKLDQLKIGYSTDRTFSANAELVRKLCSQREWAAIDPKTFGPILEGMWNSQFIRTLLSNNNNENNMPDNMIYFMNNIKRIFSTDYKVNHDDILHARATTTGIVELDFAFKNIKFKLVDVGGQRSQRKKWIHCFDNVMSILFLVAMSEYDLYLAENLEVNRMHDSLQLFQSISNAEYFQNTPVVLFFNKKDVFEEKIPTKPLSICFPQYTGANTFEEASEYIKSEFIKQKPEEKSMYTHFTNATDTRNIDFVFSATVDIILTRNMSKSGLN